MTYHFATSADAEYLGTLNFQLIQDEVHRNPMTAPELTERMRSWIASEYKAVLFREETDGPVAAYALYREGSDSLYLRQFFVQRHLRCKGIGRRCMRLLLKVIWPRNKRITVDVLCLNTAATAFWRSVGFTDYCLTLEMVPGSPHLLP